MVVGAAGSERAVGREALAAGERAFERVGGRGFAAVGTIHESQHFVVEHGAMVARACGLTDS